jgi:hypothetical protein
VRFGAALPLARRRRGIASEPRRLPERTLPAPGSAPSHPTLEQRINVLPAPEIELPSEGNIPESLHYSWSDELDCTSARCVLLGKELYLIP